MSSVSNVYQNVIEDVISRVRGDFLEDGLDETDLQEFKQAWERKLLASTTGETLAQTTTVVETNQMLPIEITLPPQPGSEHPQHVLSIQVPAPAFQADVLQEVITGPVLGATVGLPQEVAHDLLQQHVNAALGGGGDAALQMEVDAAKFTSQPGCGGNSKVLQCDGADGTSDEAAEEAAAVEDEPLNSDDDIADEDPSDFFDTGNLVLCQYHRINRTKNKWKFHLKNGIMTINGKDYVFHKANGVAEW